MNKQNIIIGSIIFITIIAFRWLNIPNFNPAIALSLISGVWIAGRFNSVLIPILALLVSDLGLAFTQTDSSYLTYFTSGDFLGNYIFYIIAVFAGRMISSKVSVIKGVSATFVSAVIFFIGSNLLTWAFSGMYTLNFTGLQNCYIAAIPFFGATLVSNVLTAGAIIGVYQLSVQRKTAI